MATEKRLIDANTVYDMGHRTPFHIGIADLCDLKELLADVPTVDAVEVVHGHWHKYEDEKFNGYDAEGRIRYRKVYSYYCIKCGYGTAIKTNYCPNCGAKMDGGKNGS